MSASQLKNLKLDLGIKDTEEDDLLAMYLQQAEEAILSHLYPMNPDAVGPLPKRYEYRKHEIAKYMYNRRGSEGEISHSENGISRMYASATVPESMLSDIIPYGNVVSLK